MRRRLPVLVLLAAALGLMVSSVATAAPPQQARAAASAQDHRDQHDRIAAYWTAERRAAARPALERLSKAPMAKGGKPGKPGGGGGDGGGGGGTTTVTGAPWTASDPVQIQIGKVYFTTADGNWQCSGGAIDSAIGRMVVTAGHCVHDGSGGPFVWNWEFIPAFEDLNGEGVGEDEYGTWTATALFTTPGWASSSDFNVDAGFAVVTDGTEATLEGTVGQAPVGSFDGTAVGTQVHAFGYPAGGSYAPGADLVYCAGGVEADNFGSSARGLKCDMTGGSSGGSWYEDFDGTRAVSSVNSFKYLGGKQRNRMFGPQFGAIVQGAYLAASDGSCGPSEVCDDNSPA